MWRLYTGNAGGHVEMLLDFGLRLTECSMSEGFQSAVDMSGGSIEKLACVKGHRGNKPSLTAVRTHHATRSVGFRKPKKFKKKTRTNQPF